jgi:hypothetical protein
VFGFRGRRRRQPAGCSLGRSISLTSGSGGFETSLLMKKRRSKDLQDPKQVCRDEESSKDAPMEFVGEESRESRSSSDEFVCAGISMPQ